MKKTAAIFLLLCCCVAGIFLLERWRNPETFKERILLKAFVLVREADNLIMEVDERIFSTASVTKYAEMHSGYRDPDGARMEAFLRCWKQQTIDWVAANSEMQDAAAALAGRYQTQDALDALPPSAQNFWRAAGKIDWLNTYDVIEEKFRKPEQKECQNAPFCPRPAPMLEGDGRLVLEPSKIKPLKKFDPLWPDFLKAEAPPRASDREYYRYNSSQDWDLRLSDFDDLLVYGFSSGDETTYGEIHNEKSLDGEYQFLFHSLEGVIFRVKSFAHLLVDFYLAEYRDAKSGGDGTPADWHIYSFSGDWNKTCVPLLFDADEIASWQAGRRPAPSFGDIEK